jgi:ABC-type sugar transport system ATPase subunit
LSVATVSIRALNKKYDNGFHAVKDVNLEIRDKEFMVLVGPSGCGKTTTLRMVAGLEEITSGEIRIGTEVVNDLPPMDRNIAMVFQNYALYPHKTVFDNMAFGLQMRGYAKAGHRQAGARGGGHARHPAPAREEAAPALRRAAPARRRRAGDRAPSAGVPVRRAALESRCAIARADAGGAQAPAQAPRDHRHLRHRTTRSRR